MATEVTTITLVSNDGAKVSVGKYFTPRLDCTAQLDSALNLQ
jgi:hypothetical protein